MDGGQHERFLSAWAVTRRHDVIHLNLHKHFNPHGVAAAPAGAGPRCCTKELPFLPVPRVVKDGEVTALILESSTKSDALKHS